MKPNERIRQQALLEVDRALDDLRRGMPVIVTARDEQLLVFPAEYISPDTHSLIGCYTRHALSLIITGMRAQRLGLVDGMAAPVRMPLQYNTNHELVNLVTPIVLNASEHWQDNGLSVEIASAAEQAALKLVKIASLLPAVIVAPIRSDRQYSSGELLTVSAPHIESYMHYQIHTLRPVGEANVPLADAKNTRIMAFQPRFGVTPHLAVVIGEPTEVDAPLVRLHSSCMTGDILGSLRCDCGDQLHLALRTIAAQEAGVILYLNQEGRGIGISNKLRAYKLQDGGLDTVEANEEMGFDADERQFEVAAEMLDQLGLNTIRLMTNNKRKVEMLKHFGVNVIERVPLVIAATDHTRNYLDTKASKCGHVF